MKRSNDAIQDNWDDSEIFKCVLLGNTILITEVIKGC